jgi:hypothetical protein
VRHSVNPSNVIVTSPALWAVMFCNNSAGMMKQIVERQEAIPEKKDQTFLFQNIC